MKSILIHLFNILLLTVITFQLPAQHASEKKHHFFRFSQQVSPDFDKVQQVIRLTYELENEYEFELIRTFTDQKGTRHHRFQQLYKNVAVEGNVVIVHEKNGNILALNGKLSKGSNVSETPDLPEDIAFALAMEYFPAEVYKWEVKKGANQQFYPVPQLVWMAANADFTKPENIRLTYKFDMYAHRPLKKAWVYVDATSGELVYVSDRLFYTDTPGSADTRYSGTQTITADSFGGGFRLRESGRGNGIETYNMEQGTFYLTAADFEDNDNNWTATEHDNAQWDNAALDAHWGAEMTYDYYLNVLGIDSYDNAGAVLQSYVHYDENFSNAFWDGSRVTYGDGSSNPFTTLDICGHEFSHALVDNTANLFLTGEWGALNESFADIFGTAIEFFAKPADADWLIGADMGSPIRSMQNPKAFGDADTYQGIFWETGEEDNGGIHSNNGVHNYWFYLLSEGGSGTNDLGQSYTVSGIGIDKAAQIAFHNLSAYLTPFSDYEEAAFLAKQAAADLFGVCSEEYAATVNAWHAVGIGQAHTEVLQAAFTTVPNLFCEAPQAVRFINRSTGAQSYFWQFGDGSVSVNESPIHTYNAAGTYTVTLTVSGCDGEQDTEINTDYIVINDSENCGAVMPVNYAQTFTQCSGQLWDSGGGLMNYGDEQENIVTIAPNGASTVSLHFTLFHFETDFDYLYIYDGADTSASLIGQFTGNFLPFGGIVNSTGGAITLRQSSDQFVNEAGFELYWICNETAAEAIICPTEATATQLGSASNIFSIISNRPNQVAVNNELNTILFMHRNNTDVFGGHSGLFRYDISTDGGANWMLNQGPVNPTAGSSNEGRYPQGVIYNIPGNTNPDNAYLAYYGPYTDGQGWDGYVSGVQRLNGLVNTENYDQATGTDTEVPGGFCQSTPNIFWTIDRVNDQPKVRIMRGVWTFGNDVLWQVHTEFTLDLFAPLTGIWGYNMAFDPSGMYGWAVFMTHLNGTANALQYHPVYSFTEDGGNSWSTPQQIDISQFGIINEKVPSGYFPACSREVDLAVDANGQPHLLIDIGSGDGKNYTFNTGTYHAMYHLTFDGSDWAASRLQQLDTYLAPVGNSGTTSLHHYTRPQVSRSDDGSKIVFNWADSDAATSSGLNNAPNLWIKGYNPEAQTYSSIYNFTSCTGLTGEIQFATVSPILIETGSTFTLPIVYTQLNASGSELDPVHFYHLNGVSLDICDFGSLVPEISVTGETEICEGEATLLNAGTGFDTYEWSTGATSPGIIVNSPGTYSVTTTDENGCMELAAATLTEGNCTVNVQVNVLLEGAYDIATGLMHTDLLDNQLLPLQQPYNRPPWQYDGTESVNSLSEIPDNAVDWLLIELRNGADANQLIASEAAFLINDGTIVDENGENGVNFENLDVNATYFVIVRHRNHLAVASSEAIDLSNAGLIDFTHPENILEGTSQLAEVAPSVFALYAGDFDSDGVVIVSDFNLYTTQAAQINVYLDGDCNLDKAVTVNDFNLYQPNASIIGVNLIRY